MTEYRFTDDSYFSSVEFHEDREAADHLHQEGHRERLEAAASVINSTIEDLFDSDSVVTITDYGCGNGGISDLLLDGYYVGYDICRANVEHGRTFGRNVLFEDFTTKTKEEMPFSDIVIMCEVLEHMQDPHGFLEKLNCGFLIASVPNGETPDNHPEYHVWGWDNEGFARMLYGAGFSFAVHCSNTHGAQIWLAY